MKNKDYILDLKNVTIDEEKVNELEKEYKYHFNSILKAIVSKARVPLFLDEYKVLSFSEIKNASKELDVDFISKKIIPLIDCSDNDYIVYHFDTDSWSMYNIVDDCFFFKKSTLEELLV